jgi:REP element-mobilizing transposase RayT
MDEMITICPMTIGVVFVSLGQFCERFNWECHSDCLMTNHYHLMIETPDGNLSQGMRQLNGVYKQLFNQQPQRVGHVFRAVINQYWFKKKAIFWSYRDISYSILSEHVWLLKQKTGSTTRV